jgi:hypothetical protein
MQSVTFLCYVASLIVMYTDNIIKDVYLYTFYTLYNETILGINVYIKIGRLYMYENRHNLRTTIRH